MKDKRRNSEKRKEKSRDAARCRRSKESEVFFELADSLPLPASVTSQLDKASVMRLAISFLKVCTVLEERKWPASEKEKSKGDGKGRADQLFPKALDGFVFILSNEGDIVYVNESVVKYLGIQQIELMGQSIFEFAHPRDEDEIQEALSSRSHGPKAAVTEERVFFLRMKCTLTSKGRNVNLKSASYKVIKCTGRLVMQAGKKEGGGEVLTFSPYLMAVGEPIPHPANIEMPMDQNTFLSKHDMNMRFTYCDERVKELIGYNSDDLEGKSVYDYHHAVDSEIVEKAYKDLLGRGKGQTMTGQYRFLARGGGWVWVVTQATVIYNSRNQKAQWVVCVHYVLSKVEQKDLVLSEVQMPTGPHLPPEGMQPLSMESLFSRKTEDMNVGYFIPAEFRDKVKLTKDNEPEDLSYLAPTAGEGSVSLGFPCFAQVALDNTTEEDERCSPSPPALLTVGLKKEPSLSPALCRVRDTSTPASSSSGSSRMSSPLEYRKAVSPSDMLSMDRFFQNINTKADDGLDTEVELIDFDARAPYIPMSGDEDLTLLPPSSQSLLTLQNDIDPGLFGKTEFVFKPKTEDIFEDAAPKPRKSVRDMICGSTAVASIEQPPDIMLQQIKRPLDMNSLEKGPPAKKVQRLLGQKQIHKVPTLKGSKDSVLLNLLLTGEDPNGYKVLSPAKSVSVPLNKSTHLPLLHLTTRDCEVNAPTQSGGLLHGAELLRALEIDMPHTPR
ncbi:hypoxia-inducible factor 1-alpha-like [Babylonia areolata]|uniref:hypoxia-inducible factor 1-alpha-like n=1 Tax=Babylonia areolata TaxID=304850 RepID=UPI003FD51ED2